MRQIWERFKSHLSKQFLETDYQCKKEEEETGKIGQMTLLL